MVGDSKDTCFLETLDLRTPLFTISAGKDYSGTGLTTLSQSGTGLYAYLTSLQAFCIAAGTTQGDWSLRDDTGTLFLKLRQPFDTPAPGASIIWPFEMPWKVSSPGDGFTLQGSVGTMGTWRFFCNGFLTGK